jgi:uncharacterized protein
VLDAVTGLAAELRRIGIPVPAASLLDGVAALRWVDIGSRAAVKTALGATLVKDATHQSAYSLVFDLYFSGRPADAGVLGSVSDASLSELLVTADQPVLRRALAAEAVRRYAGFTPGLAVAGKQYLSRVLRAVPPSARTAEFEHEAEAEIRRLLVADRGVSDVARVLRRPLPEDADFLTASSAQAGELREVVGPLARKLAAGLTARQRRRARGALDVRQTVRGSLSTGGVPIHPVFRRPRPAKPSLVVLADISGSVATFAQFTLALTCALGSAFSRVRGFVFVDGLSEVRVSDVAGVVREINDSGAGVWLDGHSDYGNALRTFARSHGGGLSRRTTVLILGDARSNYHAPGVDALRSVARRAGHVYWLNPEPAVAWGSGDSLALEYAPLVDDMIECRTLRHLRTFIDSLPT